MTKPRVAFVGRISGGYICECNCPMQQDSDGTFECVNEKCQHKGKKVIGISSNAVLFYEVQKT